MKEIGANLGGEENGGIFYGPHQAVRDGAMTTALLLNIMAETGKSLRNSSLSSRSISLKKEKSSAPKTRNRILQQKIYEQVKSKNVSTIDGVKIWFSDASAILIRPSGTEPVFRLYAEAKNQQKALQASRGLQRKA